MKRKTAVFTAILASIWLFTATGCSTQSADPLSPDVSSPAQKPSDVLVPDFEINDSPTSDDDFIFEIIDIDDRDEKPFDDSVKYDYSIDLKTVSGTFDYMTTTDEYVSGQTDSMAVIDSAPFPYGTISCTVKTSTETDSGLVFGLSGNGYDYFWEQGVSYYFFFLSREGKAYLGKVNGGWNIVKIVDYSFTADRAYRMKVVYRNARIWCFINDELMFAVKDHMPLNGTGCGIRTGMPGVTFGDIQVTNNYVFEVESI